MKSRQESEFEPKTFQDHQKFKNFEKCENSYELHFPFNFSTFKMHFRSADAANHFDAQPREVKRVTRRAYIVV